MWFQYALTNESGTSFSGSVNYTNCRAFVVANNMVGKILTYYLMGESIYFITTVLDIKNSVYTAFQSALNGIDTDLGKIGSVTALKTKS